MRTGRFLIAFPDATACCFAADLGTYKRIYVEPMPKGMDQFIIYELLKCGKVR